MRKLLVILDCMCYFTAGCVTGYVIRILLIDK